MPEFLPGVDLARRFYHEAVRPLLADRPHAAARLGPGSDVLGFDTARSTDHDWGPRLEVFVDDPTGLAEMLSHRLPKRFHGWPTHFAPPGARVRWMADTDGPVDHYITVAPFPAWCRDLLGFDPATPATRLDWLATPWQRLAEITGGAVFHDPRGTLRAVRDQLAWYPDDLWRHVLACQWQRIAQEEAFPARAAEAGDEAGARMLTARLSREVARLVLLLQRRWPPYGKWLLRAVTPDPAARHLLAALQAGDARVRQDALCSAYENVAERHNRLGLTAPLPAGRRPFFDRGYAVLDAGRFATALQATITDPELRARPLTGCVDQIVDNTDVLVHPARCRALMSAAGW